MSNHLGDTNKMVNEPITDECLKVIMDTYVYVHQGNCSQRWVNYARELERKLNAANERIKQLEEALDLVRPHCSFVHHSKKHQHAYDEPCPVVALIEKAKEAKL